MMIDLRTGGAAMVLAFLCQAGNAASADEAPASWWDAVKFGGHLQAGVRFNPANPAAGNNFGDSFTDRANTLAMNQLTLSASRVLDPQNPDFQTGFRLQGLYGTDARYLHSFNEIDRAIGAPYQLALLEANFQAHLPILTRYGMDVRLGRFEGIESVESIDPTQNFFYSHSYIFDFGVPLEQTGVLTITHLNPLVSLYAGIDAGTGASIGRKGDNNSAPSYQLGFQLNLPLGLTMVGMSHIGPELPGGYTNIHVNSALRYANDLDITWNINGRLTAMTDLNYVTDAGLHASAEGIAQYLTYALSDDWGLGTRIEFWRDDEGAFTSAASGPLDAENAARGYVSGLYNAGKSGYLGTTIGATYRLPGLPKIIDGTLIRTEFRWDHAFDAKPFNDLKQQDQQTVSTDIVLPF